MISHDISRRIARIRLDAPSTRNALSLDDWDALAGAVAEVAASDALAVIVQGCSLAFCAGSNIKELAGLVENASGRAPFRKAMRKAMDPLRTMRIPTIAAVDGDCFGAGVALALACDVRFGGEGARFAVTPAKLGISYPQEDVARLVEAVGRGQAARLLFGAIVIDTPEAARIGLIQQAVPSAEAAAEEFAAAIAANAPSTVAKLKAILNHDEMALQPKFDLAFDESFDTPDFHEGIAAFGERRRPRFS